MHSAGTVLEWREPASAYRWSLELSGHLQEQALGESFPSAAEFMFFTGAPVAHIVAYEEQMRQKRLRLGRSWSGGSPRPAPLGRFERGH